MSPTISVIIPCYNGWKYIEKCLLALEQQTQKVDEIVIVDDCSTDGSYSQLCHYILNSTLNIKIISNEENSGPGISRKNGIMNATSNYIAFCDCDDWFENTFVEDAKSELVKSEADLLIFDTYTTFEDGSRGVDNITKKFTGKDKKYILSQYPMSLCRLVVRKELVESVRHTKLRYAEDGVVVAQVISAADRISILDKPLYNYYFREDSASKKPSRKACHDLLDAFILIHEYLSNDFAEEIEFIGIKYVIYGSMLSGIKAGVAKKELTKIIESFEQYCPNWHHNPYIKSYGKAKRMFVFLVNHRLFILLKFVTSMHPFVVRIRKRMT